MLMRITPKYLENRYNLFVCLLKMSQNLDSGLARQKNC